MILRGLHEHICLGNHKDSVLREVAHCRKERLFNPLPDMNPAILSAIHVIGGGSRTNNPR
jgi:hypothetical protein